MFKTIVGGVVLVTAVVFGLNYAVFQGNSFFAPKYRALDNKVFKESEQYNDGMVRDLEELQLNYIQADAEGKKAMKAIILHRFSVHPPDRMPANLTSFYQSLKDEQ